MTTTISEAADRGPRELLQARNRLADALALAGVQHAVTIQTDTSTEEPVLQLRPLDGPDVARLTALVTAGSHVPPTPAALQPRLFGSMAAGEEELEGLREQLATALDAAGVALELGPVRTLRGSLCVELVSVSIDAANSLALLIHTAVEACQEAVNALAQVFAHLAATGLDDLPVPKWDHRLDRVALGPISMPTALELGGRLGAPVMTVEEPEEPHHAEAEAIGQRLEDAVRAATGGGLMDIRYKPACDCKPSRLQLADITFTTALRLARALEPGAEPS
ncbi:hypothetical protein ACFV6B_03640 [Streptomyces microflavus]|uniref:hypothetical protein n=1 Tax=Streptomyces microflavus TaxID=1919 RepID=UPI00364BA810